LILPNIWNPITARILEKKGYPAAATASAAVSSSLGFLDGEKIKFSTLLDILERVARAVSIPVTADIEAGYAASLAALEANIRRVIEAGVAGINLEDSLEEGKPLRPVDEQCERISRARESAGENLFINARIDSFLIEGPASPEERLEDALERARAYREAGADCVFPVGPGDGETVQRLRSGISGPLNIIAAPGAASLQELAAMGVNRVSFGPFIFRACLRRFTDITEALRDSGSYDCFADMLGKTDMAAYLRDEKE